MLSLGIVVIGILSIGVFCGCEDEPEMDINDQFDDGNDAGGDRDSVNSTTMQISPAATTLDTDKAVASFSVVGASGSVTWSVQDIYTGSILTQSATAATYQRAHAGDNVVIATDSSGNAAFATVSQL
jgi:hypothetical protein